MRLTCWCENRIRGESFKRKVFFLGNFIKHNADKEGQPVTYTGERNRKASLNYFIRLMYIMYIIFLRKSVLQG